jgi:hypothetical protein
MTLAQIEYNIAIKRSLAVGKKLGEVEVGDQGRNMVKDRLYLLQ